MNCDTQLWSTEMAFRQAMQRMLISMNSCPSLGVIDIAPLCLNKDQLASLVDPTERDINALLMTDGWFDSFRKDGDNELMQRAMERWQSSLKKVLQQFDWAKLPPAAHQQATRQSNDLISKATAEKWIERCKHGLHWKITRQGRLIIRNIY